MYQCTVCKIMAVQDMQMFGVAQSWNQRKIVGLDNLPRCWSIINGRCSSFFAAVLWASNIATSIVNSQRTNACVVSRRPLALSIHSTRRFVSRKVVAGSKKESFSVPKLIYKFGKWNGIDSPTSVSQWRIKWRVLSRNHGCQIVERMFGKWKTRRTRCLFCLPLKDEWKTLCYTRFFGTKLRGKHGEVEHKKSDSGCLIVETIFDKPKTRRAKAVHHTHIPFFDEKMETIDYELSREVS